ncbi:MAG: cold-shock protein [Blautia faecis]
MSLLYHAYVYLEFLILACTIYILAPLYGFILGEDGNDYFLHISKLSGCIWKELTEGDEVFFEPLQRDKRRSD